MTILTLSRFIASTFALKPKTNQPNASQQENVAKHQTLRYMSFINQTFTKAITIDLMTTFKRHNNLDLGLLQQIQLNDKNKLSFQWTSSNDPKTYYNLLHWSILEMNSGRDINTATARKTTDPMNHSGFIPNNRHTAMLFNQSVLEKRE